MSVEIDISKNAFETLYKEEGSHDLWSMQSLCTSPSVTMINLHTGETKNFGIAGLTDKAFKAQSIVSRDVLDLLMNKSKCVEVRLAQTNFSDDDD